MSKKELEICCTNWTEAQIAKEAGADRIELCSAIGEGGVTPSAGLILQCVQQLEIKTHVLIRPRGGDFLYSSNEIDIMKKDVFFCKENGVDGVVFGFLKADGSIDTELTKEFIQLAKPMKTTFHRAFDMCKDPFEALYQLKSLGIDYVLTSGQQATALSGASLIRKLKEYVSGKLKIMPGSGVRAHNLEELMEITEAQAYHMSARIKTDSNMDYRKSAVSMGSQSLEDEYKNYTHDLEALKLARKICNR